jgi:hypothetical protein
MSVAPGASPVGHPSQWAPLQIGAITCIKGEEINKNIQIIFSKLLFSYQLNKKVPCHVMQY